jgi:hypothetical protein
MHELDESAALINSPRLMPCTSIGDGGNWLNVFISSTSYRGLGVLQLSACMSRSRSHIAAECRAHVSRCGEGTSCCDCSSMQCFVKSMLELKENAVPFVRSCLKACAVL